MDVLNQIINHPEIDQMALGLDARNIRRWKKNGLPSQVEWFYKAILVGVEISGFPIKSQNPWYHVDKVRKALGWTQEKFAEELGVTRPTVSRWEYHCAPPYIELPAKVLWEMNNELEFLSIY